MSLSIRTSVAAHGELPHANPLSVSQMITLAQQLARRQPRTVLDVGCGTGSFSIELARFCNASISAVDTSFHSLERARKSLEAQSLLGCIAFIEQSASSMLSKKFDAVVCIGSSHAFGTPVDALRQCAALVTPGGTVLYADLVWAAEPAEEFVAFLGSPRSKYWRASDVADVFKESGLVVSHVETASRASWHAYETGVLQGRMVFANSLDSAEAAEVRGKATAWAEAYEKHGKHCLGFTAYLAFARDA